MYSKMPLMHDSLDQQESKWEPIPLHLPVPEMGYWPDDREQKNETEDDDQEDSHGVLIIDMNDYTEIQL